MPLAIIATREVALSSAAACVMAELNAQAKEVNCSKGLNDRWMALYLVFCRMIHMRRLERDCASASASASLASCPLQ
jgi:hypothetical protein